MRTESFISAVIILMTFLSPARGAGISAGLKYGYSRLSADYADPGYAVSGDITISLNSLISVTTQFSYNIYEPPPACDLFGGDCRWEKDGEFTISEYFAAIRLDTPPLRIIPAGMFLILGPGYFGLHQDITYSRYGVTPEVTRRFGRDYWRMGFVAGGGLTFDDCRGLSFEFAPVVKLIDDIEDHLDIYLGVRYRFN